MILDVSIHDGGYYTKMNNYAGTSQGLVTKALLDLEDGIRIAHKDFIDNPMRIKMSVKGNDFN